MDFNFGNAIETMSGSQEGSTFFVIAKNKGLKAGIRMFMTPYQVKESIWVSLAYRIRVQASDFSITSEMAQDSFGAFKFYSSKAHASCVGIMPLVALPTSPAEVYTHYNSFGGKDLDILVDMVIAKMTKAGATMVLDKAAIIVALQEHIADIIPEVKATVNPTPEFLMHTVNKEG